MAKRRAGFWMIAVLAPMAAVPALAQPAAQCRANGEAALAALTQGRFGQATRNFSPETARHVSASALQTAWEGMSSRLGAFESLAPLAPRNIGGADLLVADLAFAHGGLAALVGCDAEDRITTFRLVPASAMPPAASAPSATAPSAESAMATLAAEAAARQSAPHPPVAARAEAGGVRVAPLEVPTPWGPLRGALTLPAGEGPFPAVVLVAGSGANDLDETIGPNKPFRDIAEGLAKAGIASLRYDKRTFDYALRAADDTTFTVDDEVTDDAVAAARLLAKQQSIDPRRVFVLGHSEGAMLAPRIARRDRRVAGIVMLAAPARQLLVVARDQLRELAAQHGATAAQVEAALIANEAELTLLDNAHPEHPPQGSFGGAPQSWWLSLHRYDQVAVAKSLKLPMLILQGGSDFQVSPTLDFDAWKRALAGRSNVTFHLYPGMSHLFRPAGKTGTVADYLQPGATSPQVIDDIAAWIKAQPAG